MSAAWVAVVLSAMAFLGSAAAMLERNGRRDGKIDAAIEQLTSITGDHEMRIRVLESGRHRRR